MIGMISSIVVFNTGESGVGKSDLIDAIASVISERCCKAESLKVI
jgi:nucleoside-triphosphatase THEP1